LKWNFTQVRSPSSFQKLYVCEPYPFMYIGATGIPRSDIRIVTWCRLSGLSDQKSHIAVLERRFVRGCRFCVWMKSGNL
jgi:hypothetical protein